MQCEGADCGEHVEGGKNAQNMVMTSVGQCGGI